MTRPVRPVLIVSGASGLVGRYLARAAQQRESPYEVRGLTRGDAAPAGVTPVRWNPSAAREGDEAALSELSVTLEGAAAVVNLAGASIADGRLDDAHRARVLQSRVDSAQTLLAACRRCSAPPPVWFQASATGFYGDRGDAVLTESAPAGSDSLSETCRLWEAAPEDAAGARLITGRLGIVFAKDAPAWQKLLLPIKLFAGGPLGSGQQWLPWIDADDAARAILFLIENAQSRGVYNLTAPEPVRQLELTRAAATRLGRPARLRAPAFALRLALGGVADALILASARVVPERLLAEGFSFERPDLAGALDKLLERP